MIEFVDSEGFLRRDAVSIRYYIPIINQSHLAASVIDGAEKVFLCCGIRFSVSL